MGKDKIEFDEVDKWFLEKQYEGVSLEYLPRRIEKTHKSITPKEVLSNGEGDLPISR